MHDQHSEIGQLLAKERKITDEIAKKLDAAIQAFRRQLAGASELAEKLTKLAVDSDEVAWGKFITTAQSEYRNLLDATQKMVPVDLVPWAATNTESFGPLRPGNTPLERKFSDHNKVSSFLVSKLKENADREKVTVNADVDKVIVEVNSKASNDLLRRYVIVKDTTTRNYYLYLAQQA
jgi:glucose-6-phosphate isomerase